MPLSNPIVTGSFSASSLKPAPVWYTVNDNVVIPTNRSNSYGFTVVVQGGTGDVQIQVKDSSGAWITLNGEEYTITGNKSVELVGNNAPAYKITASGDAVFQVNYNLS